MRVTTLLMGFVLNLRGNHACSLLHCFLLRASIHERGIYCRPVPPSHTVAYLRLVRGTSPFDRTAVIFVSILELFLAPFRDKIAATSDQMRFLAGKCSKMRLRPGLRPGPRWGSLQRSPSAANRFTVDSRRVVPAR